MVVRKHWMGLVIASINSVVICVIGLHTGQYGLIAANLFCIMTYAWCVGDWRRDRKPELARTAPAAAAPPRYPQQYTQASAPNKKAHTGLYLAYSAKPLSTVGSGTENSPAKSAAVVVSNAGN